MERSERRVSVFFYGSFMNRAVLAEVGLRPDPFEVGTLPGFDIRIAPRANLVLSPEHQVFGVLTRASHAELERLYAHARDVLGEVYQPEAVLVQGKAGAWRPALCYLASRMIERPADADYVDRILLPARALGFPASYLARLESFRPAAGAQARATPPRAGPDRTTRRSRRGRRS